MVNNKVRYMYLYDAVDSLFQAKDDLKSDEDIFAEKTREVAALKRRVEEMVGSMKV